MREDRWREAVALRVEEHSFPAFRGRFLSLLSLLTARLPQGTPPWLAEAAGVQPVPVPV